MTRYTVMLCCNDERGMFTGRVEQVEIGDEIRLEWAGRSHRRPVIRFDAVTNTLRVGRKMFSYSSQFRAGNVFWDAVSMVESEAKRLVLHLVEIGWSVVEHATRGPFAAYARKAGA